jgi:hypothetical protein
MGKCSKDEQRKRRLKRQQVVRKGSEDTARIRDTYPATIVKHQFAPPAARSKGDRAGIAIDFHHGAIGNNPRQQRRGRHHAAELLRRAALVMPKDIAAHRARKMESRLGIKFYGAHGRDRTTDTAIFSYTWARPKTFHSGQNRLPNLLIAMTNKFQITPKATHPASFKNTPFVAHKKPKHEDFDELRSACITTNRR